MAELQRVWLDNKSTASIGRAEGIQKIAGLVAK